jgi:hypothetical protein
MVKGKLVVSKDKLIFSAPLIIGGAFLALSWWLSLRPMGWAWWRDVTAGLGAVFIGVSIAELFLKHLPRALKEQREVEFEQFFGITNPDVAGHIVVQADRMDTTFCDLSEAPSAIDCLINEAIPSKAAKARFNRLFKARRWVNAHDAEAARQIRQAFRDINRMPPELQVEGRYERRRDKLVPFVISTGLGFTEFTHEIFLEAGDKWLKYFTETRCGDVVGLITTVYPYQSKDFSQDTSTEEGYRLLVPPNWDKTKYVELPDELYEGASPVETPASSPAVPNDYAMILRHTHDHDGIRPQVWFIVAGFTAHGTAAAGEYLARHWQELYKKYFKDYVNSADGDFCQFIVGGSEQPSLWRPAKLAAPLTPKFFATNDIDSLWADRYLRHHDKSGDRH